MINAEISSNKKFHPKEFMNRKRSIGVTIFGVLTILSGLIAIPFLFDPKTIIEPFIKPFGMLIYLLSIPLAVIDIVLGAHVLKLKEWARRYLLILTAVYVVSIFLIPLIEDKNYELSVTQDFKTELQKTIAEEGKSQAVYRLSSISNDLVLMRVDYSSSGKNIDNVAFYLDEQKPDGQYKYEFVSQRGQGITIEFFLNNGTINNVRLDTVFRPSVEQRQVDTILTVMSADRQEIIFTFSWNGDGSIKNVNVKPKVIEIMSMSENAQSLSPEQKAQLRQIQEDLPLIVYRVIKIVLLGIFLIFYILTLFFFTRSKVKEQFS